MMGLSRLKWLVSGGVLLSLGAFMGMTSSAKAQTPSACYMITQTGQYVNLSSICGVEQTPTNSQNNQNNAVTGQQANQNQPVQTYGQNLTQQQAIGQQGYLTEQGTIAVPTGYSSFRQGSAIGTSTAGATVISGEWQPVLDSASLRTEPGSGSLIQQLQDGQPVRVYEGLTTNNSVFVETQNGQRGWVNIWNLPGRSGVSP